MMHDMQEIHNRQGTIWKEEECQTWDEWPQTSCLCPTIVIALMEGMDLGMACMRCKTIFSKSNGALQT